MSQCEFGFCILAVIDGPRCSHAENEKSGTQRQSEILHRLAAGHGLDGDAERLRDVGWTMTEASLCGLGQTAASAVLSALKRWPELFASSDESDTSAKSANPDIS